MMMKMVMEMEKKVGKTSQFVAKNFAVVVVVMVVTPCVAVQIVAIFFLIGAVYSQSPTLTPIFSFPLHLSLQSVSLVIGHRTQVRNEHAHR